MNAPRTNAGVIAVSYEEMAVLMEAASTSNDDDETPEAFMLPALCNLLGMPPSEVHALEWRELNAFVAFHRGRSLARRATEVCRRG